MILVFVVLLIWLDGRSLGMLMAEDKKNEKRPISYMWIILAVIGIVLMMARHNFILRFRHAIFVRTWCFY